MSVLKLNHIVKMGVGHLLSFGIKSPIFISSTFIGCVEKSQPANANKTILLIKCSGSQHLVLTLVVVDQPLLSIQFMAVIMPHHYHKVPHNIHMLAIM